MSHAPSNRLFEPLQFGARQLPNRTAMAPMTRRRSPGGIPTPVVTEYYRRRAEGGVGLIFTEGVYIDHPGAGNSDEIPRFYGAERLAGWKPVINAVHEAGAAIVPQLWHIGEARLRGTPPYPDSPGYGPRELLENGEQMVAPITKQDAAAITEAFATGAKAAQDLGFDGVALHGAHGYLIDQFFWDGTNQRNDSYGGSLEKRCRFATDIIAAVRDAVGPEFPIVFRFSQWKVSDYDAINFNSPQELETFLTILAKAGVDVFDVSTRRFWEPAFEGSDLSLAAWTRKLSQKMTIAVGSIGLSQPFEPQKSRTDADISAKVTDVDDVVAAMTRDEFQIAAIGRALLADPDWVAKVRDGHMEEIHPFDRTALETYF
jgi:2,4-dienoyl-CoA reductase-like NADH-dependent reductase (Old Yellow Enzyme family)